MAYWVQWVKRHMRGGNFAGYFLIVVFLVVNTANQVLFKTVALGPGGGDYAALVVDPLFYVCVLLFAGQAAAWLAVLKRLPLSHAYPFTSITIITLLVSGALFFGESITLGNVFGAMLIMAGVAVIAGGNHKQTLEGADH